MSRRLLPLVPPLLLSVLLAAGCAGGASGTRDRGEDVDRDLAQAADYNTQLGVGYFERGDLKIAMEKLKMALRQNPDYVPAHQAIGLVYQAIDRDQEALVHLKRAVELAPGDGTAHNSYAVLLCRMERFEQAEKHFRLALDDPFYATPAAVLSNAGYCAMRSGDTGAAERYLREALAYDPASAVALYNLSELSLRQGQALSARAFLQRLEAQGPLNAEALLLAVRIERALGSVDIAEDYADALLRRFPDSPQASQLRQLN